MGWLRASARLVLFALHTLPLMPVQQLLVKLRSPRAATLPRRYHRRNCRILGFEVVAHGRRSDVRPTLLAANHVSWIDIVVLSSLFPVSFVAKSEVGLWPFFGTLARLQRTVFVERKPSRTAEHRDEIGRRLAEGGDLILFAEGTSSDGSRILPFRTALFSVAEREVGGRPLTVQPLTIAYTGVDGLPLTRRRRPQFAWYGDMELASHLWRALTARRIRVDVILHPPVTIAQFRDRKALAAHCQNAVSEGLARALAGRLDEEVEPLVTQQPAAAAA
jgi:1-acyl-sn-glycerol-3-phosphate acyltransferase